MDGWLDGRDAGMGWAVGGGACRPCLVAGLEKEKMSVEKQSD